MLYVVICVLVVSLCRDVSSELVGGGACTSYNFCCYRCYPL